MALLAYQETGYTGAGVTHQPAADNTVTESFNKANGALGPDLAWTRKVFTHGFPFQVNANQLRLTANTEGSHEDLQVPAPNVTTPNVSMSMTVTNVARTGTGDYVVDIGGVLRFQSRDGDTNYRGYACAVGRNNIFFPPAELWHLILFRVDGIGVQQLIGSSFLALADVTLPGTFTFAANENDLTASFAHAGTGATMTVAVTDTTYTDGSMALGGSVVVGAGASGTADADALTVSGDDDVIQADPRGFLWVRNTDIAARTITVSVAGKTFQQANPDSAVLVPAGQERLIGPFTADMAYSSAGTPVVPVNYTAVTGVSAAAVRVSTPPPDLP